MDATSTPPPQDAVAIISLMMALADLHLLPSFVGLQVFLEFTVDLNQELISIDENPNTLNNVFT